MAKKTKGIVVSDKMAKTVVVEVKRYIKHPLYGKYIKSSKRYKAHDEKNEYKVGDKVIIEETKPMSKDKHWKVAGKI
ncbi:MAG: 30S ribosomal protein S17 [Candidatus Tagabacteria bacterium CG_4_10_14_0_2_um_filter_40_13]|uniref:Small ribosomal subunit protein uS17 n=3 Tax=Candidatus Tagaibacteriota TaxID=1817918 RepID=A0A2M8G925_9BACT|nr:MAG: 30S ribosomal protein S17 [Candidatus Tagabacteria bacterium CG11_big_fil_rev_8_21_14_0_20_41_11]PIU99429.1 MAG: 30S ribosomal protein S17 [Candidatus Tagabacteria bacterium CG03_land_8_20_14_0_80_41_22]PIZ56088.1 MAG: 30S ribosomal protein S17 [Candidatus Tagabacteria bacterium CG_4_10_14_0_2_um_filter_40_13]PJC25430.1 MAG: 30S ribosomal protein S17 [Candidatus Tagabacteria bacterium CG_4_9_14_0_2_um_filter_41_11]PJC69939.1 MAG: 30S ribosomal protein S17 [Candidatus Tagabacteria bacter